MVFFTHFDWRASLSLKYGSLLLLFFKYFLILISKHIIHNFSSFIAFQTSFIFCSQMFWNLIFSLSERSNSFTLESKIDVLSSFLSSVLARLALFDFLNYSFKFQFHLLFFRNYFAMLNFIYISLFPLLIQLSMFWQSLLHHLSIFSLTYQFKLIIAILK